MLIKERIVPKKPNPIQIKDEIGEGLRNPKIVTDHRANTDEAEIPNDIEIQIK